jgi:hypothetical protein
MTGAPQQNSWHDSVMAALPRAFLIFGILVFGGTTTLEQKALLRELQDETVCLPRIMDLVNYF